MIYFAVLILIIIALVGIFLLRSITNEKKTFIFIPAGMASGMVLYIFLLNVNAKILPGQTGIIISTVLLLLTGLVAYLFSKKVKLDRLNILTVLLLSCLILSVIYLSRLKMTAIMPSADADMQWAYAASFARGNNPIQASWQPDFSPNYHLGAYFLEGALLSLSKLPLITIHALLNTYFLICGSLFAIFIFWENKYSFKNLWLVAAAFTLYVSFGVIAFIIPGQNFLQSINPSDQIFSSLTKIPEGVIAKGTQGASLVDLNSLSYLPARSLSLGFALLALYFSFAPFKNSRLKILSFILLLTTTALVEESMFLPLFATIFSVFVLSFFSFIPKLNYLKNQRKDLLIIISVTSLLIIIQGGFFSDLFSKTESSFRINLPFFDSAFGEKMQFLKNYFLPSGLKIFNWFFLSPFWMALILLIYGFFSKKVSLSLIAIYSLISIFCFLTIEYKYYPSNNIRFYNFAYISAGTGFIYLLFSIFKSKSIRQNLFAFTSFGFLILTPTLLPELIIQSGQIKTAKTQNIRSQILIDSHPNTPFEKISSWASENLPKNSRLIVIDSDLPTLKRSIQFEYKGLYTILGPQNIRVLRQEPGMEFYDLVLTLNPSLLKRTKTEYVYIETNSPAYQQLPQSRKNELENRNYFQKLVSIDDEKKISYSLFKILPDFLNKKNGVQDIEKETLENLQKLIPSVSSVYISDYGNAPELSFWYRMATILTLKDKDIRRNLTLTDYMAIETEIPYKKGSFEEEYDYYLMGPKQKPAYPATLIWSNIFSSVWKRDK